MQGLAKPAYLTRFLFSGSPSVAGYCVRGGVRVVSVLSALAPRPAPLRGRPADGLGPELSCIVGPCLLRQMGSFSKDFLPNSRVSTDFLQEMLARLKGLVSATAPALQFCDLLIENDTEPELARPGAEVSHSNLQLLSVHVALSVEPDVTRLLLLLGNQAPCAGDVLRGQTFLDYLWKHIP